MLDLTFAVSELLETPRQKVRHAARDVYEWTLKYFQCVFKSSCAEGTDLFTQRKARGNSKSETNSFDEESPRRQERCQDVAAQNLRRIECVADVTNERRTAFISGTERNPFQCHHTSKGGGSLPVWNAYGA
jgi:hypothetical protein